MPDFGIGEAAAASATAEASAASAAAASSAAATSTAAASTAAASTAAAEAATYAGLTAAQWAVLGSSTASVLSLLGTAGQTKAGVDAAKARAAIARMEADSFRQKAAYDEHQARRRALLLMGKTQAITAAGGVDLSSGSPLFTELENTKQMELEALNIRRTGVLGSQAREYEAGFADYSIPNTIFTGVAHGTGSVLSSWMQSRYPRTTKLTLSS